jgi:WD40 repeat protein
VWEYDDGLVVGRGRGHSGTVADVKFSPDERIAVSVGEEGGIFIWKLDLPK